jgi:hypothetical protein
MRRNFVIVYYGCEGSSPLVAMLKKHPQIQIPVFEHLDLPNFSQQFDRNQAADIIDSVLSTGTYPPAHEVIEARDRGSPRPERSVGFKWRAFSAPGVVEALLRNRAVVFMLMRRNVLRRALSEYYSAEYLRRPHPQFEIATLSPDARRERIAELRNRHFAADVRSVKHLIASTTRHKAAQRRSVCKPLLRAGGIVQPIFYEDLLDDSLGFLNSILDALGCDKFDASPTTQFDKVNRDRIEDQVSNLAEIEAHKPTQRAIRKYQRTVARIEQEAARG